LSLSADRIAAPALPVVRKTKHVTPARPEPQ
jgi:hypothetical protein